MIDTNPDGILQVLLENIKNYIPFENYKEAALFVKNYLQGVGIRKIPRINSIEFKNLINYLDDEIGIYDEYAYWNEVNKVIDILKENNGYNKNLTLFDFQSAFSEADLEFDLELEDIIFRKLKELGYNFNE